MPGGICTRKERAPFHGARKKSSKFNWDLQDLPFLPQCHVGPTAPKQRGDGVKWRASARRPAGAGDGLSYDQDSVCDDDSIAQTRQWVDCHGVVGVDGVATLQRRPSLATPTPEKGDLVRAVTMVLPGPVIPQINGQEAGPERFRES